MAAHVVTPAVTTMGSGPDGLVELGFVRKAHGIKGGIRVRLHHAASELFDDLKSIMIGDTSFVLESVRSDGTELMLTISGVTTREGAEALEGKAVLVPRHVIPVADDEFLLSDLIGAQAFDPQGTSYGRIVGIFPGPQDRLVVHSETHERLVPVVDIFLLEVDVAARRVVLDLPEEFPAEPLGDAKSSA